MSYLSKITQKKHSVSPNIVMKSPIRLFYRNMLWGQVENGVAEVIFHGVI